MFGKKLAPLTKSLAIGNEDLLTWLRAFFYRQSIARQKFLFPHLKTDLQISLINKGFQP